jgi:hypothetical protein
LLAVAGEASTNGNAAAIRPGPKALPPFWLLFLIGSLNHLRKLGDIFGPALLLFLVLMLHPSVAFKPANVILLLALGLLVDVLVSTLPLFPVPRLVKLLVVTSAGIILLLALGLPSWEIF